MMNFSEKDIDDGRRIKPEELDTIKHEELLRKNQGAKGVKENAIFSFSDGCNKLG